MELLREWFWWGESDLFFLGIGLIVISALVPWKKNRANYVIIAACFALYVLCELEVTFDFKNWLLGYTCFFLGGAALSAALGRIIRMIWIKFFVKAC